MQRTPTLTTLAALAAALALAACDRGDRTETARSDMSTSRSTAQASTPDSTTAQIPATPSEQAGGTVSGAGTSAAPGTGGAVAPLPPEEQKFVTQAAAGGQFEVEVAKLAAEKATDPQVKSFAQMLADDHAAANDRLHQIASRHNVTLPSTLPADKKRQLDDLGKKSGADFDRQFVKMVGIDDHKHDIADFEKAAKGARTSDVRDFAQSTLPTLKKHLAAAEKLPPAGKGKA